MKNIITSLEAIEKLLNSAQEQIDFVDLGETDEVLARCKQLILRKRELSGSLRTKSHALFMGLLNAHFSLSMIVEEGKWGNLAIIAVGEYKILHPGSNKFAYILCADNRRRVISLTSWAKDNLLFWELNRTLLAKVEEFLEKIAADTSLNEESASYKEIAELVKKLTVNMEEASEPPG